jgi:type II secretory pathway pseudopilin PulG
MANALGLDAIRGIDERQAQALKQAGIDTIGKLAAMDPDAIAKRTGLSADDLHGFKTQAVAMVARAVGARPVRRRSMTLAWVMLALIVIAVVAILYAVKAPQGARARLAAAEQKLATASAWVASDAVGHISAAGSDVTASNWGQAQNDLNEAGKDITLLEQIAPSQFSGDVADARSALGRAQEAVGARDEAASQRIDEIRKALSRLTGASQP